MRFQTVGRGLLAGFLLFAGSSASAVPITYFFTSGDVTLTATVAGSPVAGPVTIALDGVKVRVDEAGLTLTLIDLSMGSSGSIAISPDYLGYNSINIDFASLTASGGSLTLVDPGPPAEYGYTIGPVMVAGQFDATNTNPFLNLTNQYFGFNNPSASGTIFVDGMTGELFLDGITLGSIDPDGPGGMDPLVLKGDFTFTGLVPEPGTALLLGLGLVGLARFGRRGRVA
jgi:PEP-CTERM motif